MLKIGRCGIVFGRTFWVQTRVTTRVWHFLYLWIFKEAKAQDNAKQQFPSLKEQDGRVYRYWKKEVKD